MMKMLKNGLLVLIVILILILIFLLIVRLTHIGKQTGGYRHTISFIDINSKEKLLNFYSNVIDHLEEANRNDPYDNLYLYVIDCLKSYSAEITRNNQICVPYEPYSDIDETAFLWKKPMSYINDDRNNQISVTDVSPEMKDKLVQAILNEQDFKKEGDHYVMDWSKYPQGLTAALVSIYPDISIHVKYINSGFDSTLFPTNNVIELYHGVDIRYMTVSDKGQAKRFEIALPFLHFGYEPHQLPAFDYGPGLYTTVDIGVAALYTSSFLCSFKASYRNYTFGFYLNTFLDKDLVEYMTDNYNPRWLYHCPVKYFLITVMLKMRKPEITEDTFNLRRYGNNELREIVDRKFGQVIEKKYIDLIFSEKYLKCQCYHYKYNPILIEDPLMIDTRQLYARNKIRPAAWTKPESGKPATLQPEIDQIAIPPKDSAGRNLHDIINSYDLTVNHFNPYSLEMKKLWLKYTNPELIITKEIAEDIQQKLIERYKTFEIVIRSSELIHPEMDIFYGHTSSAAI